LPFQGALEKFIKWLVKKRTTINPPKSKSDFRTEWASFEIDNLLGKKEKEKVSIPIIQVIQDKEFP
jgi:hypothetical protein